jgi:predicted enzyme related to lactoylglutathione lyase
MTGLPAMRTGKICYLELPASDIARSSAFYREVFGWSTRRRDDGSIAFDDSVNEVSGTWVTDRPPATSPGVLIYIMVADATSAANAVAAAGGHIVRAVDPGAPEAFAWFADPAGNILGIYQQPGLADAES